MANLAIKGHATRGSEVIALLEMLGGNKAYNPYGKYHDRVYYINEKGYIDQDFICDIEQSNFIIYTLEQFEEKFPYKVGDKVITKDKFIGTIIDIKWQGNSLFVGKEEGDIIYTVQVSTTAQITYQKEDLQPYKEETMKTITIDDFKANTKEWLIDKLHGMIISDAIKTIGNIHDELHKPKYPKTYEECCEVLGSDPSRIIVLSNRKDIIHEENKHCCEMYNLYQLLICRDAYWKIAGEQMGLGKSWEPDWLNAEQDKYVLFTHNNTICSNRYVLGHNILAFPTEEMRDAFYENFKELIENVKELL